jgi:hypothetical protein
MLWRAFIFVAYKKGSSIAYTHIDKIYKKVGSNLCIINELSEVTELDVYNGLGCPFLSYGINVYKVAVYTSK